MLSLLLKRKKIRLFVDGQCYVLSSSEAHVVGWFRVFSYSVWDVLKGAKPESQNEALKMGLNGASTIGKLNFIGPSLTCE